MSFSALTHKKEFSGLVAALICLGLTTFGAFPAQAQENPQTTGAAQRVSKLGSLKSISGPKLVLKADTGPDVSVTIQEGARIMRMAPGQTDLKSATPMTLAEIQIGDRMLVRGKPGDSPDSMSASLIVVMKQTDVAQKQQQDMQDWQKRGTGGIVTAVDAASGTVTVDVNPSLKIAVKTSKDTSFRRYAANSIKFAEAQKSTFDQIHPGDQLRARGTRSADGKELAAEEVVSGTFRNIAGTITSIDAANNTVTVKDILGKKTVVVKLTAESQMRKLPAQMAQSIAFFLKSSQAAQAATAAGGANSGAANNAGSAAASSGGGGARRGPPDFAQMVSRLPAVTLADLQKEEAVMIVSTPGSGNTEVVAITLLSGVEPILTASPNAAGAAQLLSGWNLSAPGGDAGSQ
ncbi:MAG TPA: DUF5666 domain-containing protein [Alphaproteobacteria bacterium]|nr:DUF5666 domain-containing protein [Alphaproteobacteria bacterium]